jgi:hypothetical protein
VQSRTAEGHARHHERERALDEPSSSGVIVPARKFSSHTATLSGSPSSSSVTTPRERDQAVAVHERDPEVPRSVEGAGVGHGVPGLHQLQVELTCG